MPPTKKTATKSAATKKTTTKKTTKKKTTKNVSKAKTPTSAKTKPAEAKYGEPTIRLCRGDKPFTAQMAKDLIGWEEETDAKQFGDNYDWESPWGTKVRLNANDRNRPIYNSVVATYRQDILNQNWKLNFQNIVIGVTGKVISGAHRMLALITAAHEWENNPDKWESHWPTEPVIETSIGFGCPEDDATVDTVDTGKPRSFADAFYRSSPAQEFAPDQRRTVSRMVEYAVKMLWHRTGQDEDAFAPKQTHRESMDFLNRHPRLMDCIKFILSENSDGKLSRYLSPGYLSALLYLAASCNTEPHVYFADRREANIDFSNFDKAKTFFSLLALESAEVEAVKKQLSSIAADEDSVSLNERIALIVKAWTQYIDDDRVEEKYIKLDYKMDSSGVRRLADKPSMGGIDLLDDVGAKHSSQKSVADDDSVDKGPSKLSNWLGKTVWVDAFGELPWAGKLVEVYDNEHDGLKEYGTVETLEGDDVDVPADCLSLTKPKRS